MAHNPLSMRTSARLTVVVAVCVAVMLLAGGILSFVLGSNHDPKDAESAQLSVMDLSSASEASVAAATVARTTATLPTTIKATPPVTTPTTKSLSQHYATATATATATAVAAVTSSSSASSFQTPTSTSEKTTATRGSQTSAPTPVTTHPDPQTIASDRRQQERFRDRIPGLLMGRDFTTDAASHIIFYPINPAGDVMTMNGQMLKPHDSGWMTMAPAVEWQRLKEPTQTSPAWDFPFSASDGPWYVTNGIANGFSHTPQGAALAGWHIYQGITRGGKEASQAAVLFLTDPQLVKSAQHMLDNPSGMQWPAGDHLGDSIAYKVTSFSDKEATIKYASPTTDDGAYRSIELNIVWQGGMWKMISPKMGQFTIVSKNEEKTWTRW